jgi:hypothetical protein
MSVQTHLQRELDLADKGHIVILTTQWGAPFLPDLTRGNIPPRRPNGRRGRWD